MFAMILILTSSIAQATTPHCSKALWELGVEVDQAGYVCAETPKARQAELIQSVETLIAQKPPRADAFCPAPRSILPSEATFQAFELIRGGFSATRHSNTVAALAQAGASPIQAGFNSYELLRKSASHHAELVSCVNRLRQSGHTGCHATYRCATYLNQEASQ